MVSSSQLRSSTRLFWFIICMHACGNGFKRFLDSINESFSATNISRFLRFSGSRANPTDCFKYSFGFAFLTINSLYQSPCGLCELMTGLIPASLFP